MTANASSGLRHLTRSLFHPIAPAGRAGTLVLVLLALLSLSACGGRETATPQLAGTETATTTEPATSSSASAVLQPDEGGQIVLSGGAAVSIAKDSLTDVTVVTLNVLPAPPAAPVPRSLIGNAYQFDLEGGTLSGVATVKLPLPPGISVDQFELGAYHWNGTMWERVTARLVESSIQLSTSAPGMYSIQGVWRLADASLVLTIQDSEPGSQVIPMVVSGAYRYSAPPALQHDYVPAQLTLKRDSSGGAGQVSGDASLDVTVAEAVVWFQPDPAKSEGMIEFTYDFALQPGQVDVSPASVNRFYVLLSVEDSAAPTRRLSTGIEHVQSLPIQVVGSDVIRPSLTIEPASDLRWHILLNEQPLMDTVASNQTLSLAEVLARGGLGEYRIVLQALVESSWVPVSNEVVVRLALPETPTPPVEVTPTVSVAPGTPSPGDGSPSATPAGGIPPTPTRRVPPAERTVEPTAGATVTPPPGTTGPTVTPTRPSWASTFWADSYVLTSGQCTQLHWAVQDVISVFFEGSPTTGSDSRQVCPTVTTSYTLSVTSSSGREDRRVTITVQSSDDVAIEFTASDYSITEGSCTTLHWRVSDVKAVYLNDQGVSGEDTRQVCPTDTTTYTLRVIASDDSAVTRTITIDVQSSDTILIKFWSERYALEASGCTTIHWSVGDVDGVYLTTTGAEEGVAGVGSRQVCPSNGQYYSLRATRGDVSSTRQIGFLVGTPSLTAQELIAQGVVNQVTFMNDMDTTLTGDQAGWELLVDGVLPLHHGSGSCCDVVVKIRVVQFLTFSSSGVPVDWPINPGQYIEFRSLCSGGICTLDQSPTFYLRLTSG